MLLVLCAIEITLSTYWKSSPEKSTYNEEYDVSIEVYRGAYNSYLLNNILSFLSGEGYYVVIRHQGQAVICHRFIEGIDDIEFSEIEYEDKGNALLVVNGVNGDAYAVFDKPDRSLTEKEGDT
jgi:hypothetical protein